MDNNKVNNLTKETLKENHENKGNGMAVTALIFGICSVMFGTVGTCVLLILADVPAFVCAVVAITLGFVGKKYPAGRNKREVGLICGFIGAAVIVIQVILGSLSGILIPLYLSLI